MRPACRISAEVAQTASAVARHAADGRAPVAPPPPLPTAPPSVRRCCRPVCTPGPRERRARAPAGASRALGSSSSPATSRDRATTARWAQRGPTGVADDLVVLGEGPLPPARRRTLAPATWVGPHLDPVGQVGVRALRTWGQGVDDPGQQGRLIRVMAPLTTAPPSAPGPGGQRRHAHARRRGHPGGDSRCTRPSPELLRAARPQQDRARRRASPPTSRPGRPRNRTPRKSETTTTRVRREGTRRRERATRIAPPRDVRRHSAPLTLHLQQQRQGIVHGPRSR